MNKMVVFSKQDMSVSVIVSPLRMDEAISIAKAKLAWENVNVEGWSATICDAPKV